MEHKKVLSETIEFLKPDEKKIKGIKIHEAYYAVKDIMLILIAIGVLIHWLLFNVYTVFIFGFLSIICGLVFEFIIRYHFTLSSNDAIFYYAIKLYKNGDENSLNQLKMWNNNPFNISKKSGYPYINALIEKSEERDNPASYVQEKIGEFLRVAERLNREEYQELMEFDTLKTTESDYHYKSLLEEINYTYRFGAYTSTSILIRKLTENLMQDIMISKGLYSKMKQNAGFKEQVNVFLDYVVRQNYDEETTKILEKSLHEWIRKKGNKGAHDVEDFTHDEIESLMDHSKKAIRLLTVLREEATS
jgi:hypothetical protein